MAVDANCDKNVWIGATNFEVDNKKIKIKINGDQAVNAFLTASNFISYSEFGFTLEPKRMVHNNEQTLPTTTHNSEPTNFATII